VEDLLEEVEHDVVEEVVPGVVEEEVLRVRKISTSPSMSKSRAR
jgi:hypothetical protein